MRWTARPEWEERKAALEEWHVRFVWFPVRTGPRSREWLCRVERRGVWHWARLPNPAYWDWEYRSIEGLANV